MLFGVFMDVTLIVLVAVGTLALVLGEERTALAQRSAQLEQLSDSHMLQELRAATRDPSAPTPLASFRGRTRPHLRWSSTTSRGARTHSTTTGAASCC